MGVAPSHVPTFMGSRCIAPLHSNSIFSTDLIYPLSEQILSVEDKNLICLSVYARMHPVRTLHTKTIVQSPDIVIQLF